MLPKMLTWKWERITPWTWSSIANFRWQNRNGILCLWIESKWRQMPRKVLMWQQLSCKMVWLLSVWSLLPWLLSGQKSMFKSREKDAVTTSQHDKAVTRFHDKCLTGNLIYFKLIHIMSKVFFVTKLDQKSWQVKRKIQKLLWFV